MRATLLLLISAVAAFTVSAQKTQTLKPILELKMPKNKEDDNAGSRGATVAWHPAQKKYYTVFAGNMDYPMGVFDEKGKRLSPDDQIAMIDTRGLWYDASTKLITGNGYDKKGWFSYKLDSKGLPTDLDIVREGSFQPYAQSVGTFDPNDQTVLFLATGGVFKYNKEGKQQDLIIIQWGITKADDEKGMEYDEEVIEDYNFTTVIYTGLKAQELGLLNTVKKQIELYDIQSGFLTKIVPLPATASAETTFNFAYANGIYWLFDMENRKWVGYK